MKFTYYKIHSKCGVLYWCFISVQFTGLYNPHHWFYFRPCCAACGILVPRPGIEPAPWQWKQSPNYWTAREFPPLTNFRTFSSPKRKPLSISSFITQRETLYPLAVIHHLKLNIQKTKIKASSPSTSWQIYGETVETVADFIFLGSRITADSDCSHGFIPWKESYDQPR